MSRKRLDVEAEHRRIHTTISHSPASNRTTDAQRFGHTATATGTIRSQGKGDVPMTSDARTVKSLVGALPSHKQAFDTATVKSKFANPPKTGSGGGAPRVNGANPGNSATGMAGTPARVAKYRQVSRALGGPK